MLLSQTANIKRHVPIYISFVRHLKLQQTGWLKAFRYIHDGRHQMETFSALLAICLGNSSVPGEIPSQRPVTRSFDVFFDLRLKKRLSKQLSGRRAHYEVSVMTQ